jgi:DNA invertase Pin-like site-specific DNA recombinase
MYAAPFRTGTPEPEVMPMSAEKIGPQHRARKAVLYIRQSSAHQVQHNRESQGLQYAMRERLAQLGFAQVEVIDEDLGCSAADGTLRAGFERMVAEVCLGTVGAVAAREVSRFARNSRDWQQLVEMCRVVDTLLIDQETIYAPRLGNDRLLLGLKGSLNEYELDLLRQRSLAARHEKARRGELVVAAPVGFIKIGDRLEMDPDRRVQAAIRLAIDKVASSAACARRYSGSWSMGSICPPEPTPVRSSGVALATRPCASSSPTPPTAAPMPTDAATSRPATTRPAPRCGRSARPARSGWR